MKSASLQAYIMLYSCGCQCRPARILLRVMTLLLYQSCRWGITTSAGSYTSAQRFDPPMHWDTIYSYNHSIWSNLKHD